MKLVFIASDFVPKLGGIAQFMYGIITQLPPETVEAIALPTTGWKTFDQEQAFAIHRLRVRAEWADSTQHTKWMLPNYFQKLRSIPDIDMVICCHGNHTIMSAARLLKMNRGTPYAVFLHGLDILGARTRKVWPYYKRLLQAADIVFPNSKVTQEAALSGGVHPSNLHLIHPCVNVTDLQVKVPSTQLRQRLGLVNKYIILTVARLTKAKGVDTIIQALPKVMAAVPHVHYVIIGDGPARANLEALAADYQVNSNISFLGAKAHQEIGDYFAMSNLFVMTPHENPETINVESFGIVYLEANLLGLPVIASCAGGIADAVKHEKTGLLISPGQSSELAKAIIRLQQNPKLAQQLAENGRQRVLDQFTSAAAARHFLNAVSAHLL